MTRIRDLEGRKFFFMIIMDISRDNNMDIKMAIILTTSPTLLDTCNHRLRGRKKHLPNFQVSPWDKIWKQPNYSCQKDCQFQWWINQHRVKKYSLQMKTESRSQLVFAAHSDDNLWGSDDDDDDTLWVLNVDHRSKSNKKFQISEFPLVATGSNMTQRVSAHWGSTILCWSQWWTWWQY